MNTNSLGRILTRVGSMLGGRSRRGTTPTTTRRPATATATAGRSGGGLSSLVRRFLR